MPSVTAQGVGLTFPLYTPARLERMLREDAHDDRLIISADGRILGVRALSAISFSIAEGERVALIGRNGSGKTTLLQVLAGIISPDEGEVIVEGRSTNVINLSLGVQPEATGHQNIMLRGLASGHSRAAVEAMRDRIAVFSELGKFLSMPVKSYSAGMLMRLNFAIATAFQPEILILDEWLSAGDDDFRHKANTRMKAFADRAGILILASHSERLLLDVCDRAIWLDRGLVKADGPVRSVLEAYAAFP